jgi:Resolvase, N terminal domain
MDGSLAGAPGMTTVLYCRVSTLDQTVEHQRTQAHQNGFKPDLVLADHGVSGVSTRLCERPQGRRLFDILREGDTLVVRWVDRLGRNYQDVMDTVREFIRRVAHPGLWSVRASTGIRGECLVPFPPCLWLGTPGTPPDALCAIGKSVGATVAGRHGQATFDLD